MPDLLKTLEIGDCREVSEFGDQYELAQVDYEVAAILESLYKGDELESAIADYPYLFILAGDGFYREIWGLEEIPWNGNYATLLSLE